MLDAMRRARFAILSVERRHATAGLVVTNLIEAIELVPQLGRKPQSEAIQDRRFAEAIYRIALANGVMDGVA